VEELSWVWDDSAWHDLKARDCFALIPPIHKLMFPENFDMELIRSIKGAAMFKIVKVSVLQDYQLMLEFADGNKGIVDLSHLVGKGVFTLWDDYSKFGNVTIGSSGELMWGDLIDLCPDSLYLQITKQKPEEIFPALKQKVAYA